MLLYYVTFYAAEQKPLIRAPSAMLSNSSSEWHLDGNGDDIFKLVQIDIKLKEIRDSDRTKSPFRLTRLARANGVIVFSFSDTIYRVAVSGDENSYDRLNVPLRTGDSIDHIFLDHTGHHCIISLRKGTP